MSQSRQFQREDLLGYLLGALEQEDHRRVDRALSENEQLRDELAAIRQQLVPLARVEETEEVVAFPAGLARRTCEFVSRQSRTDDNRTDHSRADHSRTEASAPTAAAELQMSDISHEIRSTISKNGSWSLADYVISATVAVLVLGLITPALLASRNQSRLLACQDNLRKIGTGLFNYAENNHDRFIPIEKEGAFSVAGAYAPVLRGDGYLDQDNVFYCSAAVADGLNEVRPVPSRLELEKAARENSQQLAQLQAYMGGSYGYTLGYYENDKYICPINLGRSFRVIMADAPSYDLANNASANHGGSGQNLLFEDGSILFAEKSSVGFPADSIFENRNGLIAAGTDVNDSVIGSSNASAWISQNLFEAN